MSHLVCWNLAELLQPSEHRWHFPRVAIENQIDAGRQNTLGILKQSATSDVTDTMHDVLLGVMTKYLPKQSCINQGGAHQRVANGLPQFIDVIVHGQACTFKHGFANETEAVRMESR